MTTSTEIRPKRRRRASKPRCKRDGCSQPHSPRNDYCGLLCSLIAAELDNAEQLCRSVGPGQFSRELWQEAVALGDAASEYLRLVVKVNGVARDQANRSRSTGVGRTPPATTGTLGVPVIDGDG